MRKPLTTLLLLAVVLLAPLVSVPASRATAQEPVEITLWLNTTSGSTLAECIAEHVVDAYNAMGTGTTVEATIQANNWQATQTAVAGGAGPDVVGTPGPSFAMQLALAGRLVPLDAYAEQFGWNERFAEGSLDLGMADGQLYSIPNEIETLVLYYNKTLFEQNEWQPPTTRDELMSLAEEVEAAGIIPFAHSNAEWRPANEWFVGEFLNHALAARRRSTTRSPVACPGPIPTSWPRSTHSIRCSRTAWFSGGLDRYYTLTEAETGSMLGAGESAMKIEGTWFLSRVDQYFGEAAGNENEWGWIPFPSVTGDAIFDLGVGRPTRSTPTRSTQKRRRNSSITTSRQRRRPDCSCNVVWCRRRSISRGRI